MTMIAGDDVTRGVESVIRDTRATLAVYDNTPPNVPEVQAVLVGAWRDTQNRIGQNLVLNPFRATVDEFRKRGRQQFGDAKFAELAERLQHESRLECQLLACGFDANKIPALLVCDDEFLCRDFTRADFVAIGTGHTTAIANMAFHEYTREVDVESAMYAPPSSWRSALQVWANTRWCCAYAMMVRRSGFSRATFSRSVTFGSSTDARRYR
ncbi:MAG: hypothetical protein H0W08_11125 [Acidobacteria bacterium]|nr:hypothetical protein [Acidobacteriota bacterium]